MIKVSIVEDDKLILEAIRDLINETDGFNCSGYYGDCESAIEDMKNNRPDVMLMDIELPGISGIEGVKKIKELYPKTDIIMLTVHEDLSLVFQALTAGACGYLDKSASEEKIIESIKEISDGGAPMSYKIAKLVVSSFQKKPESVLTKREFDVLDQLCKGQSYKEIAYKLFISVGTVRHHIKNIYFKLHVHSKSEAVAKALKERIV
ncbi:MAG: response regulator transcription factor [Ignavibacteria bacterium]|nr:response regulator transcription factor [Ignavibacteria bacterium]MBK6773279.1 response regulator transcription factor [Ignavibacteria bacterium]MBK7158458.1 response regulator transcription factor [Ignavibacteria bacterium]MBK7254983.1 response regulator transcription factor [Ignavibacteria bacterium]MBK7444849.1 response regulator transcription factor [Ignavibacteria bacterium]